MDKVKDAVQSMIMNSSQCCPINSAIKLFDARYSKCLRPMAMTPDMNLAFAAVARREYIRVGSAPASLLAKATATNTKFMSSELAGQQ